MTPNIWLVIALEYFTSVYQVPENSPIQDFSRKQICRITLRVQDLWIWETKEPLPRSISQKRPPWALELSRVGPSMEGHQDRTRMEKLRDNLEEGGEADTVDKNGKELQETSPVGFSSWNKGMYDRMNQSMGD